MRKTDPVAVDISQSNRDAVKKCTDVFWICLFIVFWGLLLVIFASVSDSLSLCVEECSKEIISTSIDLHKYLANNSKVQFCRYDLDTNKLKHSDFIEMTNIGPCPNGIYRTNNPVRQVCVPVLEKQWIRKLYPIIDSGAEMVQLFFVYVYLAWPFVCGLSGLGLVLSVILLVLMRLFPRLISWLTCFLVLFGNVCLCMVLWFAFISMPSGGNEPENDYANNDEGIFFDLIRAFAINKNIVLILAILSSATIVILVGILIFLRKEIALASSVVEEAVTCLKIRHGVADVPLVELITFALFVSFWSYVVLCMLTATDPKVTPLNTDILNRGWSSEYDLSTLTFEKIEYVEKKSISNCFWIYFVAFIWTTEFIFACEEFILGSAFAQWYFKSPQHSYATSPVSMLFKYHLGTVAKGSFLITLFRIPKWIASFLQTILNKRGWKSSHYIKRCSALFDLLESLSSSAYPVTAMQSLDFSSAGNKARKAMENANNLENVKRIGNFVMFLGKLSVAMVTCAIGVIVLRVQNDMFFYMAPALLISVFAFFIAHIFFLLVEIPMNTLVLCLCEDQRFYGHGAAWVQNNLLTFLGSTKNDQCIGNRQPFDRKPFETKVQSSNSQ